MFKTPALTALAVLTLSTPLAFAQDYDMYDNNAYENYDSYDAYESVEPSAGYFDHEGTDYLSLSIGAFDVFDDEGALDLRAEYRPDITYLNFLKPFVGVEATTDLTVWAGGGLLVDYEFKPNWYVTPSLGAGLYTNGDSDLDLDFPIQFRSQIEASYELENNSRVGLAFSHLSNAGLGDQNPGTEVLSAYWHIPY